MKATEELKNEHEGIELMLRVMQAIGVGTHEAFHALLHNLRDIYLTA
jgi:hypothetical protein